VNRNAELIFEHSLENAERICMWLLYLPQALACSSHLLALRSGPRSFNIGILEYRNILGVLFGIIFPADCFTVFCPEALTLSY